MKNLFLILTIIIFISGCEEDSNSIDSNLIGSWYMTMQTFSQDISVNENVEILDMWNPMVNSFTVEVYDSINSDTKYFNLDYINIEENDYCSVGDWYDDNCIEFEFTNISKMNMTYLNDDFEEIEYQLNCTPDLSACRPTFNGATSDNYFYYTDYSDQSYISMWDENTFEMMYNYAFSDWDSYEGLDLTIIANNSINANSINVSSGESFAFQSMAFLLEDYYYSIMTFNADGTATQSTVTDCSAIDPEGQWDCMQYDCSPIYDSDDMVVGCEDFGGCEDINSENECWDYSSCDWNYDNNSCESYDDNYGDITWSTSGNTLYITQSYGFYSMTQAYNYSISGSDLIISQTMSFLDYYDSNDYFQYELDNLADEVYGLSSSQISDLLQTLTIYASSYSEPTMSNIRGDAVASPLLRPKFMLKKNRKVTK
mgnify:FL=1|tara:strand:+ start:135 stop:1415 length:1281 start_codon:yes stop_codon:yes gene_type:complete